MKEDDYVDKLQQDIDERNVLISSLRGALRWYGHHKKSCDYVMAAAVLPEGECSCGFYAALAGKGSKK